MAPFWTMFWHVRGGLKLQPTVDRPALMERLDQGLRGMGFEVTHSERGLGLERDSPNRYSALAFVDGGDVWIEDAATGPVLRYDLPTLGGLKLCGLLSPVAGFAAWYTLADPALTAFALTMPILWLYGANFLLSLARVPDCLRRLGTTAPVTERP